MNESFDKKLVLSAHGINYYTVCSNISENNRAYGIFAEVTDDKSDFGVVENLFFTQAEATEYCKWLAENEVYPITLCEILGNIYHLQI